MTSLVFSGGGSGAAGIWAGTGMSATGEESRTASLAGVASGTFLEGEGTSGAGLAWSGASAGTAGGAALAGCCALALLFAFFRSPALTTFG